MKYAIFLILILLAACTTTQVTEEGDIIPEVENETVEELEENEVVVTCYDTDGGLNYSEFGTVTFEGTEYADECFQEDRLKEYYCEQGEVKEDLEQCQNGVCENGKCVFRPADKFGCTETDGGSILDVKGIATDQYGGTAEDYCKNGYLYEGVCDNYGIAKFTPRKCDLCEDGACIQEEVEKESQCSDTDGGVVFDVQGTVVDYYGREYNDTCAYETVLEEYSCDNWDIARKTIENCNCYQGRCTD